MRCSDIISRRTVDSVLRRRLAPGSKSIQKGRIAARRVRWSTSKPDQTENPFPFSSLDDVSVQLIARNSRVFRILNRIFEASGSIFVMFMGAYISIMYFWIKAAGTESFHVDPLLPALRTGSNSSSWMYSVLVLATAILGFVFVWQPHLIRSTFVRLEENGVIGDARYDQQASSSAVVQSMVRQHRREQETSIGMDGAYAEIGLLLSLVAMIALSPMPLVSAAPILFITPPAYYFAVNVVSRHTTYVGWIEELFKSFYPQPQLFHHDGANGFAAVGDYIIWSLVFIFFSVSILWSYMFLAIVTGPKDSTAHLLITLIMAMAVALSVYHNWIRPIWYVHRLMLKHRHQALANLDRQLSVSIISAPDTDMSVASDVLKRRELVAENLKSWPMRRGAFKIASTIVGSAAAGTMLPWVLSHPEMLGSARDWILSMLGTT